MFETPLNDRASLRLYEESDAAELHGLIARNLDHLRPWMPWAEHSTEQSALEHIRRSRRAIGENRGFTTAIVLDERIVGDIGLATIDWGARSTEIGYWLAAEHQGRGLMTAAVSLYLGYLFDRLRLERVQIQAAVENHRSRAIPERLGFRLEGVRRNAIRAGERLVDAALYGILAEEWRVRRDAGGVAEGR
jgi:ribosomal-protein-serine acetyltransferase